MTTKPTNPDGYADHLSGDWNDVPEWAIKRINFLEEVIETRENIRCPRGANNCPDVPEMSCSAVKHCYPYLCNGTCGKSREIVLSDREFEMVRDYRGVGKIKNGENEKCELRDREMRISDLETRMNAVEAIPEKDFRRDYCHDSRLTLLEAKAEGTAKELQTQINNLPRRVRAIVKESLKD